MESKKITGKICPKNFPIMALGFGRERESLGDDGTPRGEEGGERGDMGV